MSAVYYFQINRDWLNQSTSVYKEGKEEMGGLQPNLQSWWCFLIFLCIFHLAFPFLNLPTHSFQTCAVLKNPPLSPYDNVSYFIEKTGIIKSGNAWMSCPHTSWLLPKEFLLPSEAHPSTCGLETILLISSEIWAHHAPSPSLTSQLTDMLKSQPSFKN